MKNAEYFGDLSPRMEKFREDVLNKKPSICAERPCLRRRLIRSTRIRRQS